MPAAFDGLPLCRFANGGLTTPSGQLEYCMGSAPRRDVQPRAFKNGIDALGDLDPWTLVAREPAAREHQPSALASHDGSGVETLKYGSARSVTLPLDTDYSSNGAVYHV
jgi:hypothetical protein